MTYYGLYKITNLLNERMYIGQHTTDNLDDGYMGSGVILLKALNKYGKQNFRKEWLMFCEDQEELNYMERVFVDQTWVDRSDTYNLVLGGMVRPPSERGRKIIARANTKRVWSEQSKAKLKASLKKVEHDKEWVEKVASKMRGRKNPKHAGKNNPMYGKNCQDYMSKEAIKAMKQKMTEIRIGRHWYNNGHMAVFVHECPEGFVAGRLKTKSLKTKTKTKR